MGRKPGKTEDMEAKTKRGSSHQRSRPRKKQVKKTEVSKSQQHEPPTYASNQSQIHEASSALAPTPKDTDNDGAKIDADYGDDDDEDYSYEDTDTDDEESLDEVDNDELVHLLHDQDLDLKNNQIPTLYYPTLKNRLYAIMRSVKIEHIYITIKWIIALTLLVILLGLIGRMHSVVRQNGYCDSYYQSSGESTGVTHLRGGKACIPCPANGECINGELFCKPLYRPHRSFLNKLVNVVWPTAQQCTRDPVMISYATKMERKMRRYLSRQQGNLQCRDSRLISSTYNTPTHPITFPLVRTEASHMMATLKHSFGLPPAYNQNHQVELDHLATLALNMVQKNQHVIAWEKNGKLYLGTDIAEYSFLCWCWMTLCGLPLFIKLSIPVLVLCSALFTLLYRYYQAWATRRHQVKVNTEKALDILKLQREKHQSDADNYSPGCSINYLRQHVLESTNENSISMWKSVVEQLQQHPCLRHGYTDENGDLLQYFEWL